MTLVLCLTLSTTSWAKAVPIEKGAIAPFAGQLLDTEAIKLSQKAAGGDLRLQLKIEHLERLHAAELEAVRPAWTEHPVFVVAVTVVSIVGIFTVTAYGLQAVK